MSRVFFISAIFLFFTFHSIAIISTVSLLNNPTQGTLKITGKWKLGETLSVDLSNLTDVDGIGQFEYQWFFKENDLKEEILGATSSTYYLTLSDLEKSILVEIKHTDLLGNVEILQSPQFGAWGDYQYLSDAIKISQAAVVRITASSAVMISPKHAITAAHSPLDENNEITPNLTVQNIFGEKRDIIDVKYDTLADFAIVELESPFQNSYAVELAPNKPSAGDVAFAVGNPKDAAWGGVGWAVSFGFARDPSPNFYDEEDFDLFDIQIMGGFSGGGIFNEKGQLQGIISYTTSHSSDGSFRPNIWVSNDFFSENFNIHDGPWKSLDTKQVGAIHLDFINQFLALHQVTNIKNTDNIILPENKKDFQFNSLNDQQESYLKSVAGPLRKSVLAFTKNGISQNENPRGTAFVIDDRIAATNSHVVEGKEYFKLSLYDGTEISGSVLDHHAEADLSLILLDDPVPNHIKPVSIAKSRPQLGDIGFLIGHPLDLWNSHGAWQVSGAFSGYAKDEIDDRGDLLMDGYGSGGMSGGPVFNSNGHLVGINYAGGASIATELRDYQDPHSTYYNPVASPEKIQHSAVDIQNLRDLIDENSIYFSNKASPSSAFEIEYFSSNSGDVYSAEKNSNNSSQSIIIKEVVDYSFSEVKNVNIPLDNNVKWSLVDFINYNNGYIIVNTFLENYSVGVQVTKLNSSFELENSFGSSGHLSQLFTNTIVQKIIKSTIFDNKLYLLIQNDNNQQISYSVYTLDLSNPQSFVNLFESTAEFATSSHYFSKDFIVNSNGIFVGGTTDDSDAPWGKGTYDHFVSHYSINGSINTNFANKGVFQKNFGDTDKATALAIQSDGKILIAGINWLDLAPDAVATRLNTDGSIDTSFGDNGTTPVARFLTTENHRSMRDLGREAPTDIFVDDSGNIFIAGTRYSGEVDFGMLTANNGSYLPAIWKYNSSGNIVEDFGTYEYTNGKLEGIKMIKLMGRSKIQKLINVNNQLLAFTSSRDNITKNTSNKVFLIDDENGEAEVFATNEPVIYVKNPLVVREDTPLENIKINYWNPGGGDVNYSFSNPNLGSITDNGDMTFDYHPNLNENGSDSLVITFNDGATTINKKINIMLKSEDDLPTLTPVCTEPNPYICKLYMKVNSISPILTIEDIDSPLVRYELGSPENGSLKDNGDFTFTYTPNLNFTGEDKFQVSIVSMRNLHEERSSTIQVEVTMEPNNSPIAQDISLVTLLNTNVTGAFQGNDIDGDTLSYSIIKEPINGSVTIQMDKFTYIPNNNFEGSDEFTYVANDGFIDSNEAKVSIEVKNNPPIAQDISLVTLPNTNVTEAFQGNDIDGDTLSYSIIKEPINGSVTIQMDKFTYIPNNNFEGSDEFTYVANDGFIDSNEAKVSIEVKDELPPLFVESITFIEKVYPNPAKNNLKIILKNNFKLEDIYFINVSGKISKPRSVNQLNNRELDVNISNLNDGVYLLNINTEKEVNKVKLVIKR